MANLDAYIQELEAAREDLRKSLVSGDSAFAIAVRRCSTELMAEDLKVRPQYVQSFDNRQEQGFKGPSLWRVTSQNTAATPFSRAERSPADYVQKIDEYQKLGRRIRG